MAIKTKIIKNYYNVLSKLKWVEIDMVKIIFKTYTFLEQFLYCIILQHVPCKVIYNMFQYKNNTCDSNTSKPQV